MSRQHKSVETGPLSAQFLQSDRYPSIIPASSHLESADIVIIGNGIAGLTAAIEARRLNPDSRIVIITEQIHPTINTPALKQFAIGKLAREQLLAYPAGTERAQRIHVIQGRVEEIHAHEKYISLSGGYGFGYDSLLIATGSVPNVLPAELPGRNFDGILTLHSLSDYLDLRRRLHEVREAVVIGGGSHAIETVMSLLHCGIAVHWLIRSETFLPRMLDCPASDMVLERVRRAGARVYTSTEVLGILGRVGAVAGVITNNQQMIPCQLVLACTGTTPVMTLAKHCDIPIRYKHGILVDDQLRTNVPDIYAAGDVAALKHPQTGLYAPRAQWYAAVLQGRVAAAMMTGHEEPISDFGVPWHATHLGGLSMLTVGSPLTWTEGTTTLTDSSKGSYRRLSIVDDRLVGYLSLGPAQPDSLAIKRIIDEGLSIRDMKKTLLKGEFDARKYFSQEQSKAAHSMLTSKRIPVVSALRRSLPITGPLRATFTIPSMQKSVQKYTEESPAGEHLEEISTVTSNLAIPTKQIIESTLVPLPSRTSRLLSRSLWSYSDKLPAVTASGISKQFVAPGLQCLQTDEQDNYGGAGGFAP